MDEYEIEASQADEVFNEASARAAEGTRWPGMSYEQGVADALGWVLGQREDSPFHEE